MKLLSINVMFDTYFIRQIRNKKLDFNHGEWSVVSTKAKDFVSSNIYTILTMLELLTRNPSKRMKAYEIFRHPWIQEYYKFDC